MSEDKQFVNGMFVSKYEFQNGGHIIKLGLKVDDIVEFLYANINDKGFCNIDIQETKNDSSKLYACLNTYQANTKD